MGPEPDKEPGGRAPWKALAWVLAGLALCAALSAMYVDAQLRDYLDHQDRTWYSNPWVKAYVQLGKGWVAAWLTALAVWRMGLARPILCVLAALGLVSLMVVPLKPIVGRTRPETALRMARGDPGPYKASTRHSFPSGDTGQVFAAAGAIALFSRRRHVALLLTAAGVIGALRVVALAHYPSDVLAGAGLGLTAAVLGFGIVRQKWGTLAARPLPWLRPTGGVCILVITALSILLQKNSSVLLFLKYYGLPLGAVWGISVLVRGRRTDHALPGRGTS